MARGRSASVHAAAQQQQQQQGEHSVKLAMNLLGSKLAYGPDWIKLNIWSAGQH
jgi:hypothetical protein